MHAFADQLETIVHLAQNLGLTAICLLAWQFAWSRYGARASARLAALSHGLAFGAIGALSMAAPTALLPGLIFDMRMPIVALATLFVGPAAGFTAALVLAAVRLLIGGVGTAGAMYGLAVAFLISSAFRLRRRRQRPATSLASLLVIGVLIGATSLGSVLYLPDRSMMLDIVAEIALPLVLVVPLALISLGGILRVVESRRALERQLSAILDSAPAAIYLKDEAGRYMLVNACFERWFGRSVEQVRGRTDEEFAPTASAQEARESDLEVLKSGRVAQYERPAYGPSKIVEQLLVTKFPVRSSSGAVVGICGFIVDISDLRRVQKTAMERERDLQAIMDHVPAAIFLKDPQSRFIRVNRRWEEWVGKRQEQVAGLSDVEVFGDDRAGQGAAIDRQVIATGQPIELERPARFNYRNIEQVSVTKFPVRGADGSIVAVGGIVSDITARIRAEERLKASENRFRTLIEHSSDVIVVLDRDGAIRYRSPSLAEGLGYISSEAIGLVPYNLLHADDAPAFAQAWRGLLATPGGIVSGESRLRHRNGAWRWLTWSMRNALDIPDIDGVVVNARDVTEAKHLEEELQQAQKMEAIGRLAGGIAHDFNNILGAIAGFTHLALEDLPNDSRAHSYVARIATASDRAKDLVQQILSFSRRSPVERRPENLGKLYMEARDLLRAALPPATAIDFELGNDDIVARVNATQFNQILLNLCQNAAHALNGQPGRIDVRLERIDALGHGDHYRRFEHETEAEAADGAAPSQLLSGRLDPKRNYACLMVADTGIGMTREVLDRIFDPFFTTKSRGRGTGLGLAVVHGIVASHGGACFVTTTVGRGSTFTVYLPLTNERAGEAAPVRDAALLRGHERVMVIDDEEDLCDVLSEGLERLGYSVVSVSDPVMALAAFDDTADEWDVVISDQIMPQIKGLEICAQMKAARPELKFILCTGYSDGTTEEKALASGVDRFFMKPVAVNELAEAIRQCFEQAPPRNPVGMAGMHTEDSRR